MKVLTLVAFLAVVVLTVSQEDCGVPAIKPELVDLTILGGREARPGSWPWHVGLHDKPWVNLPPFNYGYYFCAGALIDEQTVLTAAHCLTISPNSVQIQLGSHYRTSRDEGEESVDAVHFCLYPNWTHGNIDDIAIIRLAKPVTFIKTISPICLPEPGDEVRIGEDEVYVTGWGYTSPFGHHHSDALQQARQFICTKSECYKMKRNNVARIICSKHDFGSSCHGDSGGPLVLERNGRWQLQGIVSGGPQVCGYRSIPMYYTEVAKYRDWIDRYRKSVDPLKTPGLCKEQR
ncbi:chymotrypsin elastase family member 2A-like [Tropilaelaps mercedesae]|uniref:Chymotrypsin elastase family member 2A-like n=1 Tax=Tropilaelaps mercedesae TaxID=418985 RepID=A0A1V9XVB3_9ACAR|nr:chymotrypsin elastase family member 2A-like [Tropilaelaps mercedesae]